MTRFMRWHQACSLSTRVADDLEGAPLAGDRPCFELGGAHIGNGPSQLDRAIEIRVNLLAKT